MSRDDVVWGGGSVDGLLQPDLFVARVVRSVGRLLSPAPPPLLVLLVLFLLFVHALAVVPAGAAADVRRSEGRYGPLSLSPLSLLGESLVM